MIISSLIYFSYNGWFGKNMGLEKCMHREEQFVFVCVYFKGTFLSMNG